MMNKIRDKVKQFLRDALETQEVKEEARVIGIEKLDDGWHAEAEVVEKDLALPGHRVYEKKRYIVTLNEDLEIVSFKQAKE
jgi:hypothetical protein